MDWIGKIAVLLGVLALAAFGYVASEKLFRYIWVSVRGQSEESWVGAQRPLLVFFVVPLVIVVVLAAFLGRA